MEYMALENTSGSPNRTVRDYSSLTSEPFEVFAQSGKRFFVHSDILTMHSEPLRSTVTGVWKEATDKKIDLSDWDEDTVGRFVQFLYFGDYQTAKSIPGSLEGAVVEGLPKKCGEDVLLTHAKVYALAQYKAVERLKTIALGRLEVVLKELEGTTSGISLVGTMATEIIELLGYTYSHTDSLTSSEEPMRDLMSTFIANNFQVLNEGRELTAVLIERSDIAAEVMEKLAKGAIITAEEVQYWKNRTTELEETVKALSTTVKHYRNIYD